MHCPCCVHPAMQELSGICCSVLLLVAAQVAWASMNSCIATHLGLVVGSWSCL